jgi:hypothetical protein
MEGRAVLGNVPARNGTPIHELLTLRSSVGGATRRDADGSPTTRITHEFKVDSEKDVDLFCEFVGGTGWALFETSSLKLTRL